MSCTHCGGGCDFCAMNNAGRCAGCDAVLSPRPDLTPNAILTLQQTAPENAKAAEDARRKSAPVCRGVLDYFPDALLEVARVSRIGNEQHNPGEPMHWAKEKSTEEADSLLRHLIDRGKLDTDGCRHSAKVAWRALALLQREIDAERAK